MFLTNRSYQTFVAGLMLSLALSSVALAEQGDKIQWSITPYLWGSTTKFDLQFRDTGIGNGELSFGDLLDILDAAFMVQIEGGKGRWSVFGDLTYLDTSASNRRAALTVNTDSKQVFLDTAVAFWPGGTGSALSLFAGLRYSGFDDRYRFTRNDTGAQVGERKSDADYYDALFGLRYRFDLSSRWQLLTHGDFSLGDSEGTFLLSANLAYIVGKRMQNRILLGYQYKQAEFKDGDLNKDFTYYGPMAGFDFRF